jgi:radical SAM superfamily enzyme YgiQ (UPF0313 family)
VRVCLVYPNVYSLGMANLGFQTVYHLFNRAEGCVCERAFMPDTVSLAEHARTGTRLFSYESQTPLSEFDVIAFSVPFEEDYFNIPVILDLAGIPPLSSERRSLRPLVMAGGVAVSLNPEPLAGMIDLFLIGEGEGAVDEFLEACAGAGGASARDDGLDKGLKHGPLMDFDSIGCAYAPALYEFSYDGPRVSGIRPLKGAKGRVTARKNLDLGAYPTPESFITAPDAEFKDTSLIEVERGCPRGCRFCAAGFLYLPPRWRGFEQVASSIRRGMESAGNVGLVGAAVSEHPDIKDVLSLGIALKGGVTVSSLRVDTLDQGLLSLLREAGYRTVTLAPEAGTERLRGVVNKGVSDEAIIRAAAMVKEAGFKRVKLYFLVGLPTESDADAEAIARLALSIGSVSGATVTLSVNPFIPKPGTPFQWLGLEDRETVGRRLSIIRQGLAGRVGKGVVLKAMSWRSAFVQAYLSRADRRASALIAGAARAGRQRALTDAPYVADQVGMRRGRDEILPWDMIDHGVKKAYLWRELERGLEGLTTPPCDVGRCLRCGVCGPEARPGLAGC